MVASKGISSPLASFFFSVIKPSTLLLSNALLSSALRITSLKVSEIVLPTGTSVTAFAGSKVTVGASTSAVVKVEFVVVMMLSSPSSTQQISTNTVCSLLKSLVGSTEIISLVALMVASKGILVPLALFSLSTMKLSTLLSSRSTLSPLRNASVEVIVIILSTSTFVTELAGSMVMTGAEASTAVKVAHFLDVALPLKS